MFHEVATQFLSICSVTVLTILVPQVSKDESGDMLLSPGLFAWPLSMSQELGL